MKKHKNKIIAGICVIVLLAAAYLWGGNASPLSSSRSDNGEIAVENDMPDTMETVTEESNRESDSEQSQEPENDTSNTKESKAEKVEIFTESSGEAPKTNIVAVETPAPTEPQATQITQEQHTCTLSVRCDTVLENMALLRSEKAEIIPKDGVIFSEQKVTFYEGESVFHVLLREMKKNKIHFEYVRTPIYNSAYVEGIANLYELDCGELSGWRYKVNGMFPNYGCSRYLLKEGDVVELVYTCDLGADVGGYFADGGGQRDE